MDLSQRRNLLILPAIAIVVALLYAIFQLVSAYAAGPDNFKNLIDSLARTPISQVAIIVLGATVLRLLFHQMLKAVPKHQVTGVFTLAKIENEMLDAIVYALVFVFMIIRPFMIQAFTIPTGSMVDTLLPSDYIVANKAIYRYTDPQVGDIVVFKPPPYGIPEEQQGQELDYIKRLIGGPGDVIEIRDHVLYRNGKAVEEPYKEFTRSPDDGKTFFKIPPSDAPRMDFKIVKFEEQYWPVVVEGEYINSSRFTSPKYRLDPSLDQEKMRILRDSAPSAIPPGHYLMLGDNRNNSLDGRSWGLIKRDAVIGRAEFIWFPVGRWGRTR